jgi:RHS repeat-associated protein
LYYIHDGNKNVNEVVALNGDVVAHYEYAPFGAITVKRGTAAASNPWCFSSEYVEYDTATVYFNYRHYDPMTGRWLRRDPITTLHYLQWRAVADKAFNHSSDLYSYLGNVLNAHCDKLGLLPHDMSVGFLQTMCCRDPEGRRREIQYHVLLKKPCCKKGETEVAISECTCRSCGEEQYEVALRAGGCIQDANNGGFGDAFRHCFGSCMIYKICGETCAFILGWGNEIKANDEWLTDSPMDIYNNAQGRRVASLGRDCATGCLNLLYGDGLRVNGRQGHPAPRADAERCLGRSSAPGHSPGDS